MTPEPAAATAAPPDAAAAAGGAGTVAIPVRPLPDILDATVASFPDRVAIDFLGRRLTYRELGALVGRAARGLQDLGFGRGDRLALCLPNCPYFVILYFAAMKAGGTVVSINPLYVEREIAHLLGDSGARIVVVPDLAAIHDKVVAAARTAGTERIVTCSFADAMPWAKSLAFRVLKRRHIARPRHGNGSIAFAELIRGKGVPSPVAIDVHEIAVLQYTGGTTGTPKGAMLSHANLAANAEQTVIHAGGERPGEQDRVMGVLPLFHVFALTTVLNFSIRIGAEMILLPRYEIADLLAAIRRTRPTYLPAVPTIYGAIVDAATGRTLDFSSLRDCISGGAPLPVELGERFEALTGAKLVEGYGLSETAPIITCNPLEGEGKHGSTGPAYPATAIEIRSLDDPAVVLGPGERGEVCVRGPQVMAGYWNRPEETANAFIDGALRTGDVGYLDEDGFLFLVDRIKDVILCGGYNVYPRVIEDVLYEHPAVAEAVVIGLPDRYRGQAPKAFVTLRPDAAADPDLLCAFLAERISKIEMPRSIEIRAALPKTLIGKLSKKELIEEERRRMAGA